MATFPSLVTGTQPPTRSSQQLPGKDVQEIQAIIKSTGEKPKPLDDLTLASGATKLDELDGVPPKSLASLSFSDSTGLPHESYATPVGRSRRRPPIFYVRPRPVNPPTQEVTAEHVSMVGNDSLCKTQLLTVQPDYPHAVTCPLLEIFPAEVRIQIYKELLCSAKLIRGGEFVEDKRAAVILPHPRPLALVLNIDATILRTCRAIYNEALPVLYQENWFTFRDVQMLYSFRTKGLATTASSTVLTCRHRGAFCDQQQVASPLFAFQAEVQGRLCFVRNLHLRFAHGRHSPATIRGWQPEISVSQFRSCGFVMDGWGDFLNEERYHDAAGYVAFYGLVNLVLDFSEWNLKDGEGLRIRAFEAKFRGKDGLKQLATVGLSHVPTIKFFQAKLLREGGEMRILPKNALGDRF